MLRIHDELPSTMEAAHRLAESGAPAGEAVLARRQVEGRGRQGRTWDSGRGGLWLSVIARPDPARGLDALSLRIGLALARELEATLPVLPTIGLKWPNDLMVVGRKLAGILVEARWSGDRCLWVVVGVGVNVHNPIDGPLAATATRLDRWGPVAEVESLAPVVAGAVAGAAHGGPLDADELAAWHSRDILRGKAVTTPRAGTAVGVSADGALEVVDADGRRHQCRGGVVALTD